MTAPVRISEIGALLGLDPHDVEPFGWYCGKLVLGGTKRVRPARGKYICVTSMTPTPLGEGKTVTAIALAMALCHIGRTAVPTLRQPSLAPLFGVKGGGAGGGHASLVPADQVNLHLTGDSYAIAAAHNLMAAMVDNHAARGLEPQLDPASICVPRVVDCEDRGLRRIRTGLGGGPFSIEREAAFELVAASETMAVLGLATSLPDLRERLGRMVVGTDRAGAPITAQSIGCAGAMTALLRDALRPNLVQTSEGTPALVHTGPFGNVAHGNSSVVADVLALEVSDYVVTESGFGADCGAEKLFHIKCRASGRIPDVAVVVCTARATKLHGVGRPVLPGKQLPPELLHEDLQALARGAENLEAHVQIVRSFGIPVVVAINRFETDSERELDALRGIALDAGAVACSVSDGYARGGQGALELAEAVARAAQLPSSFRFLYDLGDPLEAKIEKLATRVYGASGIELEPAARRELERLSALGFGRLPVCIAKTQFSLSHDPARLGRPRGYPFPIRAIELAAGAGFVRALAGKITTLPGLPADPAARHIDVDSSGAITGLR